MEPNHGQRCIKCLVPSYCTKKKMPALQYYLVPLYQGSEHWLAPLPMNLTSSMSCACSPGSYHRGNALPSVPASWEYLRMLKEHYLLTIFTWSPTESLSFISLPYISFSERFSLTLSPTPFNFFFTFLKTILNTAKILSVHFTFGEHRVWCCTPGWLGTY